MVELIIVSAFSSQIVFFSLESPLQATAVTGSDIQLALRCYTCMSRFGISLFTVPRAPAYVHVWQAVSRDVVWGPGGRGHN